MMIEIGTNLAGAIIFSGIMYMVTKFLKYFMEVK